MGEDVERPESPISSLVDTIYERSEKVGEGAYGLVYKGRHRISGNPVALKRIRINAEEGIPATALREITVLRKLKSRNVISLRDVVCESSRIFLVFEYLEQDLKAYMDSIGSEGMDFRIFVSFSGQLLCGLAAVHSHMLLHRDLKPQNILIDKQGNLKIADFGLARAFSLPLNRLTHEIVTLWYRAPCILLGQESYSTFVDIWAAACIIAEMSQLAPLFPGDSEIDQLFKIFQLLGTPNEDMWPGVTKLPDFHFGFPKFKNTRKLEHRLPFLGSVGCDLLGKMLVYPPHQRLTAKEALHHDFFSSSRSLSENAKTTV